MKIFIKNIGTCGLNYQSGLLMDKISEYGEIIDKPSFADVVIFTGTCACTELQIITTVNDMQDVLDEVKKGTKIYMTGCLTRPFTKDNVVIDKVNRWIELNIDEVIPQNNPTLLFEKLTGYNNSLKHDGFGGINLLSDNFAEIFISNGCLNRCSFCKTTYQKYPLKSSDICEAKEMVDFCDENGISHVHLKGTNICQFGIDNYGEYKLLEH